MAFFNALMDFFSSLFDFSGNSLQKADLRKIELFLKNHVPPVYKNELLLPAVGEAFYTLYSNSSLILEILNTTIFSENVVKAEKCINLLFTSCMEKETKELYSSLSFERRKAECIKSNNSPTTYEIQKKDIERFIQFFYKPYYKGIEKTIYHLEQLRDICCFNYYTVIKNFNNNFSTDHPSVPGDFLPIQFQVCEQSLLDFYYLVADCEITTMEAKAIAFLAKYADIKIPGNVYEEITSRLQKILGVLKKVLSPTNILNIMKVAKKNISIELEKGKYEEPYLDRYIYRLRKHFNMDTSRLQTEVKDSIVSYQIETLFGDKPLLSTPGYDETMNMILIENDVQSFQWIRPLQIMKTFLDTYFTEPVMTLLNDLVVEGFFNNPDYKSEISSSLLSGLEVLSRLKDCEEMFAENSKYDQNKIKAIFYSEVRNAESINNVPILIDEINKYVYSFLQGSTDAIVDMRNNLEKLFLDAKKSHQMYIININLLFTSARNREAVFQLEEGFPFWKNFLDIMANYVILKRTEK